MEGLEGMREGFLCVRESQVNEFVQNKTQHLHGQLTFGRPLSFGAASVEGRSEGGIKVSHKMLGLKNRVS